MSIELNAAHVALIASAGKDWAKGNGALVKSLTALYVANVDSEVVDHYRDTFYANAIATACAISVKAAEVQVSLRPYDFKKTDEMTDKNRSPAAQRVFNAGKMAWSRGRDAAGFAPRKVNKRGTKEADADAGEPQVAERLTFAQLCLTAIVEPCADIADAIALVKNMASVLRRVHDTDPSAFDNDAGAILRGAMTDLANAASDAQAALDLETEAELARDAA